MKRPSAFLSIVTPAAALFLLAMTANAATILRYTDHEPYGGMRTRLIKETFFAALEKESSGRLKIEDHWDGKIATGYDALHAISAGKSADMGIVVPEYAPNELPLHQLFKSYPLGPRNGDGQVNFFRRVYAEAPEFNAELKKNNLVNLQFFLGYPVGFFTVKPKVSLGRLNGTKWRTASFWRRSFLSAAGATPVAMPWNAKITEALQDGRLDGLMVNLDSAYDIGALRAAPNVQYSQSLWLGHVYLLVMNQNVWDKLDSRDREAIRRAAASTQKVMGASLDRESALLVQKLEKEGARVHSLQKDELKQWQDATKYQEVQKEWIEEQKNRGVTVGGLINVVNKILNDMTS